MAKGSAIDCQNVFLCYIFQNQRNVYSLQGDRKLPVAIRNEMFRAEFSVNMVKEYWQLCYLVVRSRCVDLITSLLILAFLGWSFHLKTISVCMNDCYGENLCIKKNRIILSMNWCIKIFPLEGEFNRRKKVGQFYQVKSLFREYEWAILTTLYVFTVHLVIQP